MTTQANGTSTGARYTSTLLIPVDVVWLPYTSLVLLVIFWLGYDFYRFHEKNRQKYARMRETQVVESAHNRKRINMINCKGLKYKNGLPDFGAVWNTSPSCSDVSTPSPSARKTFPHSTDITPSEDGGGTFRCVSDDEDGVRTASEISPHADGLPILDDRRKLRAPRQAGSGGGGGGGDRYKGDETFGSQTSHGFTMADRTDDGTSATLNVTVTQKMRGKRSRERSSGGEGSGSYDGGGGGGVEGGGGGGGGGSRQRRAAEDDELRFTDHRDDSEKMANNMNDESRLQAQDGCVVGDAATQTSYTVADLHYNPPRSSPQVGGGEGVYAHPGVVNPRVLAISPPSQGGHQGGGSSSSRNAGGSPSSSPHGGGGSSSSPRTHHRSRHDSSSSSPHHRGSRPAATAAEFAAQSMDEELNRPIIIDFSRSNSMRDERNQDSPSNPATPRQSRRHEPRQVPDDYGPVPSSTSADRKNYEPLRDESVFPGSVRKGQPSQDVLKVHESSTSHSRQHSSSSSYSNNMNAHFSSTGSPSSKSRSSSSSVSKRHQQHHHQPQPPPYTSLQEQQHQQQNQHQQQPLSSQHVSTSSSRHSIQVESYEDPPPASPRPARSARDRESRSRDRDTGTLMSSNGRKQTETHYRHPQHIDVRDTNPTTNASSSSSSQRETPRTTRSEKSSERFESSTSSSSKQYKESSRQSSSIKHPSSSSSSTTRQVKSARAATTSSSSSPRNNSTSGDRRNRKSSDSSKHSSSESPKIPSHFYHQDEEGFFSSMSSNDHNNAGRLDSQQQLPRRGIHFFSQLGTGRRDSMAGFGGGGRKISSGAGGGGFGEDDGDGGFSSSSYKGGGFDS